MSALQIWLQNHNRRLTQEAIDEALMEYIRHIEEELEAARKDAEWQPIETAPKYRDLVFYREDAGVFIGKITHCAAEMTDNEIESSELDEETLLSDDVFSFEWNGAFRCDGDLKPTHWKPLPAPPAIEQAKEGV